VSSVVARADASPRVRANQDLHDALMLVSTNGQAIAAADLVIGALTQARDHFSAWSLDSSRRYAYSSLDDALKDVGRFREPLAGNFDQLVTKDANGRPAAAWDDLFHAIKRGYGVMWAVQDVQGDDPEWLATLGLIADIAVGTVQALPDVIRAALHFTSELATDVVGGTVKGLLPLWPIVVAGVAVVVVGAIVLAAGRKRGLVA
jgi:hypothetical protein